MAQINITPTTLNVALSGWEKAGALRTSDVEVPRSSIRAVTRSDNARHFIRGIRMPGTGWPGLIALGTWRKPAAKDFVAVNRNDPGYCIELHGQNFDRLVVSSPPIAELDQLADDQ